MWIKPRRCWPRHQIESHEAQQPPTTTTNSTTCTRKTLLPAMACKIELCANIWPRDRPGPAFWHGHDVLTAVAVFLVSCIDFRTTIKSFLHAQIAKYQLDGDPLDVECLLWKVERVNCGYMCGIIHWNEPCRHLSTLQVSPWSTCNASEIVVKWVKVVIDSGALVSAQKNNNNDK